AVPGGSESPSTGARREEKLAYARSRSLAGGRVHRHATLAHAVRATVLATGEPLSHLRPETGDEPRLPRPCSPQTGARAGPLRGCLVPEKRAPGRPGSGGRGSIVS